MSTLTAVDVFAGGGGLTVGLKRAGFQVVAAVEIEKNAADTYKANHPEVALYKSDIRTITGNTLAAHSPDGKVSLLAGCPPCQGFCSLTSKYKRADPRNALIAEMARLVKELEPTAVMMENVPGLAQKGKRRLNKFLKLLSSLGYQIEWKVLQVADFGIPQQRRRLVLFAGKGFEISLPTESHARIPESGKQRWTGVGKVFRGMPKPLTLKQALRKGGPEAVGWNVIRNMSDLNVKRLRAAKPGKGWTRIPKRLRPDCHKDRKTGFRNVYGRMAWAEASPTITGGCTTLSKGRFGHPRANRTISVREAALIQTFPRDYVIKTSRIEQACNIVGNALPCDFAEILARKCQDALTLQVAR